jgi:Fur family transcriptional regulator, peroxide stress response regulator
MSRQREAILRVVRGTNCHPTAEWVYCEVKKAIPGISLGTVYRNLGLLADQGELCTLEGAGGVSRYDGCTASHYHFRCERCGVVIDVDEPVDLEIDRRVSARSGLKVRGHTLEFRGLCLECEQRVDSRVAPRRSWAPDQVNEEVSVDGSIHGG